MIETSYRLLEQSRDFFVESKYLIQSIQLIEAVFTSKKASGGTKPIGFLPFKNYMDKMITEHKAKQIQANSELLKQIVGNVKDCFECQKLGSEFEEEINRQLKKIEDRKWFLMQKELNLEVDTNLEFLKEIKGLLDSFLPERILAKQLMKDLRLKEFEEEIIEQAYPGNPRAIKKKMMSKSVQAGVRKNEIIDEPNTLRKRRSNRTSRKAYRRSKNLWKDIPIHSFEELKSKIKVNFSIIQAARNISNAESYICHMDKSSMYVSRKDMPNMIKIDVKGRKVKGVIPDENYDQSIYLIKKQIVFGFINDYIYVNKIGEVPIILDKAESTMVGKFFDIDENDDLYYLSNHRKTLKKISNPDAKPLNEQMVIRFSSPNQDQIMDYAVSRDCNWVLLLTFNGYLAIFREGRLCSSLNLCLSKSEKAFNISVCPDFRYVGISYWDSNEIQPKLKLSKIIYQTDENPTTTRFSSKFMSVPFSPNKRQRPSESERKNQILAMISSLNNYQESPDKCNQENGKFAKLELIDFYKDFSSCSNISGIAFVCYYSCYPIFVVFQAGSEKRVHYFGICDDKFKYLGSVKGIYSGVIKEVKMVDGDVYAIDSDMNVVKLEILC